MTREDKKTDRPQVPLSAIAVFFLSASLGVIYLAQIRDVGFVRRPLSDSFIYDQRAREIASGHILGPAGFVHAPLYAYVLGAVRILFGDGPWVPQGLNVLLNATSCVLLLTAGRLFCGPRAGVVAGVVVAIFPPLLFFCGLAQKTTLAIFLCALLLWLSALARDNPGVRRAAACGGVMGLLVLTQQSAGALIPLQLLWLWFSTRERPWKQRGKLVGTYLASTILVMLPWAVRNRIVTGEFVLTTPNVGQNFAMGNNPRATGTYLPFRRGRANAEHEQEEWVRAAQKATGRTLSPREVSDYYMTAALDYIRGHPGEWARLMVRKIVLTWNIYETPDTEDYYLYQEHSWLLRSLDTVFHFGVLAGLAATGAVLSIQHVKRHWILYAWLVVITVAVAMFVVFGRYRILLAPVLALFAGAAAEAAPSWRMWTTRRRIRAGIALVLTMIVCAWPLGFERRPYTFSYTNHAVALADLGRYDDALREVDKGLNLEPKNVDALLVRWSGLLDANRCAEALHDYQQARTMEPKHSPAHRGIGDALMCLGHFDEAASFYQQAVDVDPEDAVSVSGLATIRARQGRVEEAMELFRRALALQPDRAETHLNLGNTYMMAAQLDKAEAEYAEALRLKGSYADASYSLGVIQVQRGNADKAAEYFRRTLHIRADHAEAREALIHLEKTGLE